MMAKQKVTTTTVEEKDSAELEAVKEIQEETSPEFNELMDYLESIGTSANMIKIYKIVDGARAYCGQSEPGVITEDAIIKKWHGGAYWLVGTMNGRYVPGATRRLNLFEPPEDALKSQQNNGETTGQNLQMQFILQQMQNQQAVMIELIKAMGGRDTGPNMADIVGMVRDMQAMAPKPPDIGAILPGFLDLFKTAMQAGQAAGAGPDTSWPGIISGALEKLPLIFSQISAAKANPPAPGNGAEETMSPEAQIVRQALAWLKGKAKAGKSVETIADMLADNMDDPLFGPVAVGMLQAPFEELIKFDPEIGKEPYLSWFRKLYTELKEVMKNADTDAITGASGGAPDASGNETPSD